MKFSATNLSVVALALASLLCPTAWAAEHVTLQNGFEMDCARREAVDGGRVRLFLIPEAVERLPADSSYIDVASDALLRVEIIPDPVIAMPPLPL